MLSDQNHILVRGVEEYDKNRIKVAKEVFKDRVSAGILVILVDDFRPTFEDASFQT